MPDIKKSFEEPPGLLSSKDITQALAADFYSAAAYFYKSTPWKVLDFEPIVATIEPEQKSVFVHVMGQGGMEFGLLVYWDWNDYLRMLSNKNDPADHLPENGWLVLSFEKANALPEEDVIAIEKYGWEIAGEQAFPLPGSFQEDGFYLPTSEELTIIIALLRAIPHFSECYNQPDPGDRNAPGQSYFISTAGGQRKVTLNWLPEELAESLYEDEHLLEIELELPETLMKANQIAQKASDSEHLEERQRLARLAFNISSDCASACVLLAEEAAKSPEDSLRWFQRGVKAGERIRKISSIDDYYGELWRVKAARPYLRALQGAADCYRELGKEDKALELYQQLLELNEDDHQGIRYPALSLLIKLKRDEEAIELLEAYEDEDFAAWPYSLALLHFRKEGDTSTSRIQLQQAVSRNPYVPEYLLGKKSLPEKLPEYNGIGDENEAMYYVVEHYPYWWNTPGAVDWLKFYQAENRGTQE